MKKLAFLAIGLLLFSLAAVAQQIQGDYIETRSADVYTGECFANGEMNLVGNEAILGWHVAKGSWNGVALDNASIVAVVLLIDHHVHRGDDHLLHVVQQAAAHVVGEGFESLALRGRGLLVDDQHRLGGIGILVGIAQGALGANHGDNGGVVERHAVPGTLSDVPAEDGLVADQVHLAVGKAFAGINVGAAGFDIVALDLLGHGGEGEQQKSDCE